jgi:hypothetical protein
MGYAIHVLTVSTPTQPLCNAKAAIGSVLLVVFLQLTAPPATQEDFSIPQVQLATA